MFWPTNTRNIQYLVERIRLVAMATLVALFLTSGCTGPNATAGSHHAAAGQASRVTQSGLPQTDATQSETPLSPAGLSPEINDVFQEAQVGNAKAMAVLGGAYETGEGAPQDFQQALAWFTKSAAAGNGDAMCRLGRMYATGAGVPKDYREALLWYKKAAAAGNVEAMYDIGRAYENGTGVREDVQQAVNWYDEATLRGNKAAKAALDRLGESFDHQ